MKTPIVLQDKDQFLMHWKACGGTEASMELADTNAARVKERDKENRTVARSPGVATPTISEMSKSLASSMVGWAKAGFALASDEVKDERLSICRGCEFWKEGKYGRCMKCGCSGIKLWLASEKCPIGKWDATSARTG